MTGTNDLWKNLFIHQCPSFLGGLHEKMGSDNSTDFGFEFGTGMGDKTRQCSTANAFDPGNPRTN
ncbi:hypothetical protein [Thermococcus sp. 5-4]|uniref:hypothetical protein n=1 Tax=Thermococcus sp. 5-4 TaxID=2008440 RepID=UPI001D04D435|nr:hypothetical protein [Thermococcus sp. 5-4]